MRVVSILRASPPLNAVTAESGFLIKTVVFTPLSSLFFSFALQPSTIDDPARPLPDANALALGLLSLEL